MPSIAPEVKKPTYAHINIDDKITVTKELKQQLDIYENAPEIATIQNITERMAQAASVVSALSRCKTQ